MPDGLRSLVGAEAPPAPPAPPPEPSAYAGEVQPIFEEYCVNCHGPSKQKADLHLDSYAAVMEGDVLIPGDPDGSMLLQMMRLPLDDLDRMPPEGKPQPSPEQVAAVEAWIAAGATE